LTTRATMLATERAPPTCFNNGAASNAGQKRAETQVMDRVGRSGEDSIPIPRIQNNLPLSELLRMVVKWPQHGYMQQASSAGRRDLKIHLSPSMGASSESVCLTTMVVKWHQQAVSLSVSPAGRRDLNISLSPHQIFPGQCQNLIISQGTTRNLDESIHKVSLLSLSNHTFLPNDNLVSQPHISSQ